jgi:outer membrane protein insertion porin family
MEGKRNMISGAFFVDLGNSWQDVSSIDLRIGSGESQMKIGAGFGVRFNLPGFPIRLDWGYGFNHKIGEDNTQFYFTIGSPF